MDLLPLVQPARYPPGFLGEFTVYKKGLARLPHAPAELKSALRFNFLGILSASRIYSDAGGVVHSYRGILYIVRRSWTCSNRRNPFSRFAHQPSWIPMTTRTRPRCGLQSSWLFGRFLPCCCQRALSKRDLTLKIKAWYPVLSKRVFLWNRKQDRSPSPSC